MFLNKSTITKISEIIFVVFLLLVVIMENLKINTESVFSILSSQFLHGKLYLPQVTEDAVLFNGRYYWHLGPFPTLLLLPLSFITEMLFDVPMPQNIVNIVLIFGILFISYNIARKFGFNSSGAVWNALAVVFSSVFFLSALLPWSWHFSQSITFFFGLLALREFLTKKRYALIGLYHGFIFMTRFTAGFGVIFYILDVIFSKDTLRNKIGKAISLSLPVILSGFLLLGYNYARFGDVFDNGYLTSNNWVKNNEQFRYELLNYGLFNIKNIPTNFYYYFLNVPAPILEKVPDFNRNIYKVDKNMIIHVVRPYLEVKAPGVSFFIVSPYFLYIFKNKIKTRNSKFALFTVLFILSFLLTYYWTGWTQIGPRYLIDLLPFLYVLLLESFETKTISEKNKLLIALSALFNLYLFQGLIH